MITNKRGLATAELFEFMIFGFVIIIVIGAFVYFFNYITTSLDIDIMLGQVNLSNATQSTLGQVNNAILNRVNTLGIFIIMGMIIGMFINAYLTRQNYPKIFIVIDIIILIMAYILATLLSNSYEIIINNVPFTSIFTSNLSKSSLFLLRLPLWTSVIGIIIMILTYSGIPITREEVRIGTAQ